MAKDKKNKKNKKNKGMRISSLYKRELTLADVDFSDAVPNGKNIEVTCAGFKKRVRIPEKYGFEFDKLLDKGKDPSEIAIRVDGDDGRTIFPANAGGYKFKSD